MCGHLWSIRTGCRSSSACALRALATPGTATCTTYILRDDLPDGVWEEKLALAMEKLYERGRELRGQVSGEHVIGYAKRAYLNESLQPRVLALMRAVKRAFNPNNILNPIRPVSRNKGGRERKLPPAFITAFSHRGAEEEILSDQN